MDINARLDGFKVHPLDLFPSNKNLNANENKITLNTANLDGFKVHPIDLFVSHDTNHFDNNSNSNKNISQNYQKFYNQTSNNLPAYNKVFNIQTNNNLPLNYKTFYTESNNNIPSNSKEFNSQTNHNINVVQNTTTTTNSSNILNLYQEPKNMSIYEPQIKSSTTIYDKYPKTISTNKATFQVYNHSNGKLADINRNISYSPLPIMEQSIKFTYPYKNQKIKNINYIQQKPVIEKKINIIKLPRTTIQNITTNTYENLVQQNNVINSREPYMQKYNVYLQNNQPQFLLQPQSLPQPQAQPLLETQPKPHLQLLSFHQPQAQPQPQLLLNPKPQPLLPQPKILPQPQLQLQNQPQFQPQLQLQTLPQSQAQQIKTAIIYKNYPMSNDSNNYITQTKNTKINNFNQISTSTGNIENINYTTPHQQYNIVNPNIKIYRLNTPTKNLNLNLKKFPPTTIMNLDIDNGQSSNIVSLNTAQNININNQNNDRSFLKSLKSSPNLYKGFPYSTASYEPETTPGEYQTKTNLLALKSYFNPPNLPRNNNPTRGDKIQEGMNQVKTTIILPTKKSFIVPTKKPIMVPKKTTILIPNISSNIPASPQKSSNVPFSPAKSPIISISPAKSPISSHYSPVKSPIVPSYYSPIKSPKVPNNMVQQVITTKKIINSPSNNIALPLSTFPLNAENYGNKGGKKGVFPMKQNIFIELPSRQRALSSSPIKYNIPTYLTNQRNYGNLKIIQ